MPYIVEIPFDQNDYLRHHEPGVCNSLVLEWVVQKGAKLTDMRRTIKRARNRHARGVNLQLFVDYGLWLFEPDTIMDNGVRGQTGVYNFVDKVFDLVSSSFLIGASGENGGHALGMIKLSPSNYPGFDPNNGYYRMGDGGENDWLMIKIFELIAKYKFRDLTCFGFI